MQKQLKKRKKTPFFAFFLKIFEKKLAFLKKMPYFCIQITDLSVDD
jgi:hypothetical protein